MHIEHLARRKAIYEALHPETKKGVVQAIKMNRKLGHNVAVQNDKYVSADDALTYHSYKNDEKDVLPSNFAENTSVKTGLARRTIEEDVQIATRIPEDVRELLRATPVAERSPRPAPTPSAPRPKTRLFVLAPLAG